MIKRRAILTAGVALGALSLASCGSKPNRPIPQSPANPYINYILVEKSKRKMHFFHNTELYKTYDVALGFAPNGHKLQRNDGRTPEGRYFVDRVNPRSTFYLSIGINYPNAQDIARAEAMGVHPGSDIFIHGGPTNKEEASRGPDWTAGCIAVTDDEIFEIYQLAGIGTVVDIRA